MKSAVKSFMKSVQKDKQTSTKKDKKKGDDKAKKKSKDKKHHANVVPAAPPPMSVMSAPGTVVATPSTADAMGLSTKNPGRRTKKSLPAAGKTVMLPVQEPSHKSRSENSDFELANSCMSPVSTLGAPSASPSLSPATSPHHTTSSSSGGGESPGHTEVQMLPKEFDLPMEPDQIIDPEKEVRAIAGRDPDDMTPDQLNNLRAFCAQYEQMGVRGLMEEFNTVKGYNLQPFDITGHEHNTTKNRYQDIFCIDQTRVRLMDGREGDYIHANYVNREPLMNRFITTQGPLDLTVVDFWRLVVQENVGYIFMLCSIIELGKKKCEQYYPEVEGETRIYGDFRVTLEKREDDSHFVNCKLLLDAPGKPKRLIYHSFWKNWPDRGVPVTALAGLRLLHLARRTTTTSIVHCSAGVGRTGTLVALEWLLQQIITTSPPYDMRDMLRAVRNQRAHAIQTAPQYAYVCFVVFRLLTVIDKDNKEGLAAFHKFSADMQTYAGVILPPKPAAVQPPSEPALTPI